MRCTLPLHIWPATSCILSSVSTVLTLEAMASSVCHVRCCFSQCFMYERGGQRVSRPCLTAAGAILALCAALWAAARSPAVHHFQDLDLIYVVGYIKARTPAHLLPISPTPLVDSALLCTPDLLPLSSKQVHSYRPVQRTGCIL